VAIILEVIHRLLHYWTRMWILNLLCQLGRGLSTLWKGTLTQGILTLMKSKGLVRVWLFLKGNEGWVPPDFFKKGEGKGYPRVDIPRPVVNPKMTLLVLIVNNIMISSKDSDQNLSFDWLNIFGGIPEVDFYLSKHKRFYHVTEFPHFEQWQWSKNQALIWLLCSKS